jgi:hypothetical protein
MCVCVTLCVCVCVYVCVYVVRMCMCENTYEANVSPSQILMMIHACLHEIDQGKQNYNYNIQYKVLQTMENFYLYLRMQLRTQVTQQN